MPNHFGYMEFYAKFREINISKPGGINVIDKWLIESETNRSYAIEGGKQEISGCIENCIYVMLYITYKHICMNSFRHDIKLQLKFFLNL